MPDRTGQILKLVCLALLALLAFKLVDAVIHVNPLSHVVIPDLPVLASAQDAKTNGVAGINPTADANATNISVIARTNSVAIKSTNHASTNDAAALGPKTEANSIADEKSQTNSVAALPAHLNKETSNNLAVTTNLTTTPAPVAASQIISNGVSAGATNIGTNALALAKLKAKGTHAGRVSGPLAGGMGRSGGAMLVELPPDIRARIERIYESEILAPAVRPLPMGLMGIAGDVVFLRSANGQTGLVKEGDTLGDLKLLRIGINRVLVEQDGQKKELLIFEGYGGQSLLPQERENKNEKTNR